jgi:hypothetical protein
LTSFLNVSIPTTSTPNFFKLPNLFHKFIKKQNSKYHKNYIEILGPSNAHYCRQSLNIFVPCRKFTLTFILGMLVTLVQLTHPRYNICQTVQGFFEPPILKIQKTRNKSITHRWPET